MNKVTLVNNGFPATNKTWRFMQEGLRDAIDGITSALGEKVILTGVVVDGSTVSNGFIILNGEIFKFIGGALSTTVTIDQTIEQVGYKTQIDEETLTNADAYVTRTARCGTGGINTFNFSELVRLTRLQDVFVPVQATELIFGLIKLATLSEVLTGTVNDKAVTPQNLHQYLQQYINVLHKGSQYIGDVDDNDLRTIYIPELNTSNYMVLGSLRVSTATTDYAANNDVYWTVYRKFADNFQITLKQDDAHTQNLFFDFILIGL